MENKKIDFNVESDLKKIIDSDEFKKDLLSSTKNFINKEGNFALAMMKPFLAKVFKRPKIVFWTVLLTECLLYGIISQSYSLVKFIINLDIFKFLN